MDGNGRWAKKQGLIQYNEQDGPAFKMRNDPRVTAFGRFLRSVLFGVTELDGLTIAGVSILLCAVTLAACYFPARHAAKVNPTVALRYE
jgi:hypothetical protein